MTPTTTPTNGVVALRTIGAVLVELPFTPAAGTYTWAASIWPAGDRPAGWGRQVWSYDPARRGWIIPPSCTHGTVIELGAATTPRRWHPARTLTAWYSVALAHDHQWLVCTTVQQRSRGPTPRHPTDRPPPPRRRRALRRPPPGGTIMSTDPHSRPDPQRAVVLFAPPNGQTPVDVRLPHRLQPGWLEAARDHLEAGREWLAQQEAEEDWDDDDLDDRP